MQSSALLMPKREGQGPGARRIKAMAGWRGLPVSCSPALAARYMAFLLTSLGRV